MQDHIPDALITAFERQYDSSWNDPQLRNERLAMRYGWAAAMEAKCLHQIQEPAGNHSEIPSSSGKPNNCPTVSQQLTVAAPAAVAAPERWPSVEVLAAAYEDAFAQKPFGKLWANLVVLAEALQARAALAATPADHVADAGEMVENVRKGAPYDNPDFERLARDLGVWGTAQSAICAQFWLAATTAADALTTQLGTSVAAIESGHDPFCASVVRGKPCDCKVSAAAAPVVLPEPVAKAIDRFDAYFRSANGVPPNARISVPTNEWEELRALLATGGQVQAEVSSALKPCPFCGGAAHFDVDEDNWEWVECSNCGMQGNRSASLMEDCKPKLIEAWNRRTPTPQAQADARDAEQEVLMEHSGCGSNTQVDMLTVRLNPGDKVVMHKGRITQGFDRANRAAIAAAKGEQQ